ncbi:hypothetical protein FA95DRAFT_956365 [Auriscalpium vulgare]|uniref:Uncharacterized protein n=1 Tax=Auriscalpium vulgare TaxID=40419 RepID=A0ACB8R7B2_9AGAM|nr:hypothetical protein FA95DRAFT_956365 [Auriscalpium vulgare]
MCRGRRLSCEGFGGEKNLEFVRQSGGILVLSLAHLLSRVCWFAAVKHDLVFHSPVAHTTTVLMMTSYYSILRSA